MYVLMYLRIITLSKCLTTIEGSNSEKNLYAYRDYSIIVVLLGTGLRQSELCSLKWTDIDFKYQTLSVFGKSRKRESIPVADKVLMELATYKTFCEQTFVEKGLSEYVLQTVPINN